MPGPEGSGRPLLVPGFAATLAQPGERGSHRGRHPWGGKEGQAQGRAESPRKAQLTAIHTLIGSLLSEEQQCGFVSLCLSVSCECLSPAESYPRCDSKTQGSAAPCPPAPTLCGDDRHTDRVPLDKGRWTLRSSPTRRPPPQPPLGAGIAPSPHPFLELRTHDLALWPPVKVATDSQRIFI